MEFRILGRLEVEGSSGALDIRGPKRRGLLVLLVLNAGHPIGRDRIIDALWDDDAGGGAARTVQTYISQLRKLLGPEAPIKSTGTEYQLDVDSTAVDAMRFEDLARKGLGATEPRARREYLAEALACWHGRPLEEFSGLAWADAAVQRLEQRRVEVLQQRIDADLALGSASELIVELESLVRAYPLVERFWAQFMLALYRSGRQGDALRAYAELRSILADELGIEPSRELSVLELRILDQDETLHLGAERPALETQPGASESLPTGTVTLLLTDIVGSTELWDNQPGEMAAAIRAHELVIDDIITAAGGHLLKHRGEGDSSLSAFARAGDALQAAVTLQERFAAAEAPWTVPLALRIALHTGEVDPRDRDYFGPTVNRAARIRSLAAGNEILCSRATAELIADSLPPSVALIELGPIRLKGLRRSEVVYRIARRHAGLRPIPADAPNEPDTSTVIERGVRIDLRDESTLIARQPELDRIGDLMQAVEQGRPSVLFVRGDAGVGKTRLLNDFVEACPAEIAVHVVACSPQGTAARVALADIVSLSDPTGTHDDVVALVSGRHSSTEATDAGAEQLRCLTRLRDAIRALATERPALLVIEDIHWAEPGFLDLIEFLVQDLLTRRDTARLLLVLTRRTFAVPTDVEAVIARLERVPGAKTMTLRPLREVDVDELIRSFGVDPPGRLLVRLLYERSRGNPLYVREALRRIADLDGFVERAGRVETRLAPTELGSPADLQQLVSLRLADLPDDVVDVLALASVAGVEFDPALLARLGPADTPSLLAVASRAGLLSQTTVGYRFTHPIIHATFYDELPPERRRLHHRTFAAALDQLPDGQRSGVLLQLAHHWLEGGLDDAPGRVGADLWEAGRRAAAFAEWGEAARCYDGAITIALREMVDEEHVAWMRYWSGRAHDHHYDPETAIRYYSEALDVGRRREQLELWGRAALALATRTSVTHRNAAIGDYDPVAWNALVDALRHVTDETPGLRAELLWKYAEMRYQALEVPAGLVAASEAVALARRSDDRALVLVCESTLAYGYLAAGDACAAIAVLSGVRDRIDPGMNAQHEGFALTRLALGELAVGRLVDALQTAEEAFAVFDTARHHAGACMTHTIAADILLRQGEREEGEARAREAAQLYRISEYSQSPPVLYSALAVARADDGDYEGARSALKAWSDTGERGQGLAAALIALRAGDILDTQAFRDRAHRMMQATTTPNIVQIGRLGALAEIAVALDDAELARNVVAAVDGRISSEVVFAPGLPFHVETTRALALVALHSPEAPTALRDASAAADRIGLGAQARRLQRDLEAG